MIYEFKMFKSMVEDHYFWVAESNVLNGCSAQGETPVEAYNNLEEAESEWIDTAKELGWDIPEVPIRELKIYSGKIALRVSPLVHKDAAKQAEDLGISINQYISNAIVAYNERSTNAGIVHYENVAPFQKSASISLHYTQQTYNIVNVNIKKEADVYA